MIEGQGRWIALCCAGLLCCACAGAHETHTTPDMGAGPDGVGAPADGVGVQGEASVDPEGFDQDGAAPPPAPADSAAPLAATTWDPQAKQMDIMLSSDLLTASEPAQINSVNNSVRATVGKLSGRWYWEITVVALGNGSYHSVGFGTEDHSLEMGPQSKEGGCGYIVGTGMISCGTYVPGAAKIGPGDHVGVALDLDQRRVYFRHNGKWQLGTNPAAGSGGQSFSSPAKAKGIYPMVNISNGDTMRANFGASPFAYPVPAGFKPGW